MLRVRVCNSSIQYYTSYITLLNLEPRYSKEIGSLPSLDLSIVVILSQYNFQLILYPIQFLTCSQISIVEIYLSSHSAILGKKDCYNSLQVYKVSFPSRPPQLRINSLKAQPRFRCLFFLACSATIRVLYRSFLVDSFIREITKTSRKTKPLRLSIRMLVLVP